MSLAKLSGCWTITRMALISRCVLTRYSTATCTRHSARSLANIPVRFTGSSKPGRIDFRIGSTNPAVIELVVCPKRGGGNLYGSQNRAELSKLVRIPQSKARLRVLLLIDLSPNGVHKSRLKRTYDLINSGPGKFPRFSVRVVYVHRSHCYDFIWQPGKKG